MSVVVRFAPSPTGYIHAGNARVAVINWLFARHFGGTFLLRLDDTDRERSKPEFIEGLYEDMRWLGLNHDQFARQSDREERYREAQRLLIESGHLYPCYETFEELERKRKLQLARKEPPLYDRAALHATRGQIAAWEKEGRRPYWRFRLSDGTVAWNDLTKGYLAFEPTKSLSDPVLVKDNGMFLYTFASVVDDLDFGITHIIRGEDHVTNTAVQIQLFEALAAAFGRPFRPGAGVFEGIQFAHLGLLLDEQGQPFSKRLSSFCLRNLREEGIEPTALIGFLTSLGSSQTPTVTTDLKDLAQTFTLESIRGGARVAAKDLQAFQHKILHILPFEIAKSEHPEAMMDVSPAEWEVIRDAIDKVEGVKAWKAVLHGSTPLVFPEPFLPEDAAYIQYAAAILQELGVEVFTEETWESWVSRLKQTTGRKGFALAHPLRVALTGRNEGPEMKKLLPLMGRDQVLARLRSV